MPGVLELAPPLALAAAIAALAAFAPRAGGGAEAGEALAGEAGTGEKGGGVVGAGETSVGGGAGAGEALVAAARAGKVVDLTYAFDAATVYWPTEEGFRLEKEHAGRTEQGYYYAANRFCTAEHGGTHIDAPLHFAEGGLPADRVPLTALIAPAAVVDVSAAASRNRDYRLTVADLEAWEGRHGRIPAGAIVLMRSGWGARWPDRERYLGTAARGDTQNLHFPGFSTEAAEWLVRERDVAAIGVDTPSIDHGPSRDFAVHQVVNGAGKPGLENVANLELVAEAGATLVALPMKIGGGTGAPARIVAILP